jgi:hypothetical protein
MGRSRDTSTTLPHACDERAERLELVRRGVKPGFLGALIVHRGRLVVIELKTLIGELSAAQGRVRNGLIAAGPGWHLARGVAGVESALMRERIQEGRRLLLQVARSSSVHLASTRHPLYLSGYCAADSFLQCISLVQTCAALRGGFFSRKRAMPDRELRPAEVEIEDPAGRLYRVLLQGHGVHLVRARVMRGSTVYWQRLHYGTRAWHRIVALATNKLAERENT